MQRTRSRANQEQATSVKPKMSQALCKNMTKLCVSSILSARNLLDPSCFKKKPFGDGMSTDSIDCFEKLQDGSSLIRAGETDSESEILKEGALLQQWIEKGVFDAIEQQYLKSMSLIVARVRDGAEEVIDELGDDVVENYTFKYEYSENGECLMDGGTGEAVVCTKQNMLKQSKDLIRNMTMFNDSLPGLPEKRTIIIKLKYHSHCPEDYEPSFFRAASADAYSKFAGAPKRVQLGDISTPFHAMTLTFTGANWLFEEDDDDFEDEEGEDSDEDVEEDEKKIETFIADMHGEEDLESELPTQPETVKAPSATPQRARRSSRNKGNDRGSSSSGGGDDDGSSSSVGHQVQQPVENLERRFGRMSTGADEAALQPVPPAEPEVEDDIEDDDEDDDATRLDFDDDATRLDDDDDDMTQCEALPLQPESERAILNYLRPRASASVGIIAFMTKIDELTVGAILSKMADRNLVARKGRDRWMVVKSDEFEEDIEDDSASVMSDAPSQLSERRSALPPPPPSHRRPAPKSRDLLAAAAIKAPLAFTPTGSDDGCTRKQHQQQQQQQPAPASYSSMPPPAPPKRKNLGKQESPMDEITDLGSQRHDDDEEESDPCGMGGTSLSQSSTASQGRSKYSVVEKPIRQLRKRAKSSNCR